jgi:hypothetical protein
MSDIRAGGDSATVSLQLSTTGEHSLEFPGCVADQIWFTGCALTTGEITEEMTEQNRIFVEALLGNRVSDPDEEGRAWSVRDGIKTNRLDQMRGRNRAFWYPRWLLWLSIIIYMKKLAYLGAFPMGATVNSMQSPDQARTSLSSEIEEEVSMGSGPGLIRSSAGNDLETIMAEAVDPTSLAPQQPEDNGDGTTNTTGAISPERYSHKTPDYYLLEDRRLCITRTGRLGLVEYCP